MNELTPAREIARDAEPVTPEGKGSGSRNAAPKAEERDFLFPSEPDGKEDGEADQDEKKPALPSRWIFVSVALVLLALLGWGVYGHWRKHEDATATRQQAADRTIKVRVVAAEAKSGPVDVTLPGETQAFDVANVYARATGYVTERRADIGSRVRKGDLLIHIAAPDLDQQLAQAKAQLGQVEAALLQAQSQVEQANANLNLAKVNLSRADALVGKGFETLQNRDTLQANQVTQQANVDAAKAGVKVADANVKAQHATVDRLEALTAFENVVAPFDGIVTARNVDIGALVNADTASGTPLFTVAQDKVLRVLVQVPQTEAVGVRDGLKARISVPQYPGRIFEGTVTRSSVALVSSARTLTTEIDIPNEDGTLRSGLFAYISVAVPRIQPDISVPAETLMFNQNGMQVAVVGSDNKVTLQPVTIYRDHGTSVDLKEGLHGGERVVLSPPATLESGTAVAVETDADKPGPPGNEQASRKS